MPRVDSPCHLRLFATVFSRHGENARARKNAEKSRAFTLNRAKRCAARRTKQPF
ncbi:Uncharacterized protein ChrSV_4622 [Chromobacterium vaccinii]|nr:Uncharacterized protein ChrSW_4622 [Chromobacterium vaccinii]QND92078.1 Uncharacterized protein ChrSV_4622 [Chromobacterium vaccinii]